MALPLVFVSPIQRLINMQLHLQANINSFKTDETLNLYDVDVLCLSKGIYNVPVCLYYNLLFFNSYFPGIRII